MILLPYPFFGEITNELEQSDKILLKIGGYISSLYNKHSSRIGIPLLSTNGMEGFSVRAFSTAFG